MVNFQKKILIGAKNISPSYRLAHGKSTCREAAKFGGPLARLPDFLRKSRPKPAVLGPME